MGTDRKLIEVRRQSWKEAHHREFSMQLFFNFEISVLNAESYQWKELLNEVLVYLLQGLATAIHSLRWKLDFYLGPQRHGRRL